MVYLETTPRPRSQGRSMAFKVHYNARSRYRALKETTYCPYRSGLRPK